MNDDIETMVKNRVEKERASSHTKQAGAVGQDQKSESNLDAYCIRAGEIGTGIVFARLHEGQSVFNKDSREWWAWTGHHWVLDVMDGALKSVESVAQWYTNKAVELSAKIEWAEKKNDSTNVARLQADQRVCNKMADKLRTERGRQICLKCAHSNHFLSLEVSGDQFDSNPWLFGCANGVIDLQTGELREGRPEDYVTKARPIALEEIETEAPEWERVLWDIFEDTDMIQYLQRLLGYSITGFANEPVLPFLIGQGRNGKTTIVEQVSKVVGDMAGPIQSEMLLDQGRYHSSSAPSPDIMDLRGLRIAFASEIEEGRRFSASRVKWLSGGDTLIGRAPHDKRNTRFKPSHSLILMANSKPDAPMSDFAFWQRIHMIPFEFSFVDREPKAPNERRADKHLPEKLQAEGPGILAWLLRGCLRWQRDGLCPPEKIRSATEEYRRSEDLLQDFIDEHCLVAPGESEAASELYDTFKDWWVRNVSKKTLSQKKFGRLLGQRFKRIKSSTTRYEGIRLLKA